MTTDRSIDMGADSRAISPFLDANFYGQMSVRHGVVCSRVHDKVRQFKGIDVEILSRADQAYIDEKVKIDNINNPPSAFSFELSSVQRGEIRQGWFLNKSIVTSHYLIGCVFSKNTDKRTLKESDIDYISATMVAKAELCKWLASIGIRYSSLVSLDEDIRKNPLKYRVKIGERRTFRISAFGTDKVWLTYSAWLSEAPINLVVPKTTLDLLPRSRRYVISRNGFVDIGYPLNSDILVSKIISNEIDLSSALERISVLEYKVGIDNGTKDLPY